MAWAVGRERLKQKKEKKLGSINEEYSKNQHRAPEKMRSPTRVMNARKNKQKYHVAMAAKLVIS